MPVRPVGRGRIGSEAAITLPKLADDLAVFVGLRLELARDFSEDGEPKGYVTADCRDGKRAATFLARFIDGTEYAEEPIRACTPGAAP